MLSFQVKPLTDEELEQISTVFHQVSNNIMKWSWWKWSSFDGIDHPLMEMIISWWNWSYLDGNDHLSMGMIIHWWKLLSICGNDHPSIEIINRRWKWSSVNEYYHLSMEMIILFLKCVFLQFETGVRSGRIRSGVRLFSTFWLPNPMHGYLFTFNKVHFSL